MVRPLIIVLAVVFSSSCGSEGSGDEAAAGSVDDGAMDDGSADSADGGAMLTCDEVNLAPLDDDPDQGFIDVTDFCLEEINRYRAMEGLEPYTIKEDARCCSALEARQAWLEGDHHNGDFCDWRAQGAAGGGRNPNGTARKSMEWVPRLFYQEMGDTFEESGGHYQAMMRPETRPIACGWYGHDRDNHRVVVNYW